MRYGYRVKRGLRGLGDCVTDPETGLVDCSGSGVFTAPCLTGSGPLQPGQVYCATGTTSGPGPVVPSTTPGTTPIPTNIWLIGAAVGVFIFAVAFGGRR